MFYIGHASISAAMIGLELFSLTPISPNAAKCYRANVTLFLHSLQPEEEEKSNPLRQKTAIFLREKR